jgi:membrane protease YdiL (CAAX protease family)
VKNPIKKELAELWSFLQRYVNEIIVIGFGTLFLTLDKYHPISPQWASALVYFGILPVLTLIIFLRKNPLDFGFGLGSYRIWGLHLIVVIVVSTPVLILVSRFASLSDYYTIEGFSLWKYSLETTVYMIAWEFLFRGFMLFGLKEKLGEASILVQIIPFVLLYFGKPEMETISTILVGIYLGYVCLRSNSYWPAVIMHLYINIGFRVIVNFFSV